MLAAACCFCFLRAAFRAGGLEEIAWFERWANRRQTIGPGWKEGEARKMSANRRNADTQMKSQLSPVSPRCRESWIGEGSGVEWSEGERFGAEK